MGYRSTVRDIPILDVSCTHIAYGHASHHLYIGLPSGNAAIRRIFVVEVTKSEESNDSCLEVGRLGRNIQPMAMIQDAFSNFIAQTFPCVSEEWPGYSEFSVPMVRYISRGLQNTSLGTGLWDPDYEP